MIKLLIFDLDGTLFDTAQGITNAFNNLLVERGEAPIDRETIVSYIGTGLKDLLVRLGEEYVTRLGDMRKLEEDFKKHYNSNFLNESQLYPGVIDFLDSWEQKLAIVSNKQEYYVRELVAQTALKKYNWEKIFGGNSLPTKKPHPQPLLEVLAHSGVKAEETLMIGDGLPDVLAARAAGVKSVAVSFGYTPISELIQSGAHATISSYKELPKAIHSLS